MHRLFCRVGTGKTICRLLYGCPRYSKNDAAGDGASQLLRCNPDS